MVDGLRAKLDQRIANAALERVSFHGQRGK